MRLTKKAAGLNGFVVFGLVASVIAPRVAFGWGHIGHATVALIAQDRLDSATLAQVQEILGPNVTLDQIASCADQMRAQPVNCANAFQLPQNKASSAWHFIDIPISDSPSVDTLENYCQGNGGGNCVVDQVRNNFEALKDPQKTQQEKQVALMFLVHFVGDEHQPLHCAEEIDANGNSDYGGNAKPINFSRTAVPAPAGSPSPAFPGGTQDPTLFTSLDDDSNPPPNTVPAKYPLNLHHFWDNMIETDSQESNLSPRTLATQLEQDLNRHDLTSWVRGDFVTKAVLESFGIAKDKIYPQYAADQGNVDVAYQQKMQPLAFLRVEMAGVRLAYLLEQALGNGGAPPIARKPTTRKPARKPIQKPTHRKSTSAAI